MPKRPDLEVRRAGTLIATLRPGARGRLACRYSPDTLNAFPGGTPILSCSLPLQTAARDATAWCRGLLPEGQHLNALAANAGVLPSDTYGLLARYGRDIAGAFEIAADGAPPREQSYVPYSLDELEKEIAALDTNPLGVHDDSELSIAGLQDKLLVVRTAGGWARPRHGYPSTHILKLDHRIYAGLVDAEGACLELARSMGLTSVDSHALTFGAARVLVVQRFDRRTTDIGIDRLHQEDLLQALGISPEGRAKYQNDGRGPPSWWHLADLVDRYSAEPDRERVQLLRAAVFTAAIGNADGHAKNFALLYPEPGVVTLAPLYDTVPTALWPTLRSDAALTVNDKAQMATFAVDDFVAEARRWRLAPATARAVIESTCEELIAAAAHLEHEALAELVTHNAARLARSA